MFDPARKSNRHFTFVGGIHLCLATGKTEVVFTFSLGDSGIYPESGLIYLNGALYGTASAGGASYSGTAFKIDPVQGAETVLYAFRGGTDAANPYAGLIYENGAFY